MYTRSYYRKESAAFLPHELNANVYTSRQFSKGKFTFNPMGSFPRFIIGISTLKGGTGWETGLPDAVLQ
jgi:hypothetical protein